MAVFETAVEYVLSNEGDKYIDKTLDAGGPTRWGITQTTLAAWRSKPVSTDDVKNLSETEAKLIYKNQYWHPLDGDQIAKQEMATAILDIGVNMGIAGCSRLVQRSLGLVTDGHMGPVTIAALNREAPGSFLHNFLVEIQAYYITIVEQKPNQIVFLKGWLSRSQKMITLFA